MFLEESNRIELLELALECENKSGIQLLLVEIDFTGLVNIEIQNTESNLI